MKRNGLEWPEPRWWAEPITPEEFDAFAPKKLELIEGNIMATEEERLKLLALLLKNCGVQEAAFLTPEDDWRESTEHAFSKSFD